MLLIYPPVAKASEPPGGIPILGGSLKAHNIPYKLVDMNYESSIFLLNKYFEQYPKKRHNLDLIRSEKGYKNLDRYKKIINELTTGLNYNLEKNISITLANYSSTEYDMLKSEDLLRSATDYKDNPFYEYYSKRVPELLLEHPTEHIGISLQFLNQAVCAFALIGYLHDNYPSIKIVLGGGLTTSWAKSPYWDNQFKNLVDKILIGPGEASILEYLGVVPKSELLTSLKPDYDFTNSYAYFSPGRIIPIAASLGCGWKNCTFCPEKAEDNPFIAKRADKVIEEMLYLEKRYKPSLFHFLDNEINPSLLKALSKSTNTIPWYGFTKFYPLLLDLDFCKILKEKGCHILKLGLESGDQKVLDSMNKGINLDDVKIILHNLKKAGIKTFIYLLFGTPEEDYHSAKKTLDFVLEYHETMTYLNLAIFNLPVNSELARTQKTYKFSNADLTLYSGFEHPKGWNRPDVRNFLNNEFKTDQRVKIILNRTPPLFNANHAYFLKDLK